MVYNPKNFRACGAQIEFPSLILFGETPKIQYRNRYLRLVFLKFFSPAARILSFLHREGYQQYAKGPGRRQVWGNHHSIAYREGYQQYATGPGRSPVWRNHHGITYREGHRQCAQLRPGAGRPGEEGDELR